jgi:uncharacterized membrane protein
MQAFIHEPLGWLHTAAAILALLAGAWIFWKPKGTRQHRQLGYVYFASMLLLNFSAIPITNMTGSIGLFHVFVVISLPTVLGAMYFPMFARLNPNWKRRHFEFTYWSYVGLVAAFVAEALVRLPVLTLLDSPTAPQPESLSVFLLAVFVMFGVMLPAEFWFRRLRTKILLDV